MGVFFCYRQKTANISISLCYNKLGDFNEKNYIINWNNIYVIS